ncbi:class F sortase [Candidatus Saccharibacteria bacterium]|nr:class F sortase [Candidatus Saccharibacteria bacterium]
MMILEMNLKIKGGWRRVVKWTIWSILAVIFLVFLIRVATFESAYYGEKEGSERAVAEQNAGDDLDETEPTEQEVAEYTVAPDRPRYLTIEKLGVKKSRILPMGVNTAGELDTPNNIFDVGWYEASGKPGQGGTMVIDGHNGGPHIYGVFKSLPNLVEGDIVQVERGDGVIFKYKVVENKTVPLAESDKYMTVAMKSPEHGKESVTLISCTGEWSQSQGTYLSRQFTRAILVD